MAIEGMHYGVGTSWLQLVEGSTELNKQKSKS